MAAKNLEAIRRWVRENRPDLTQHFSKLEDNDGFILVMTTCFEAGRLFQSELPDPKNYNGPEAYLP
jgi:hypothetical protein